MDITVFKMMRTLIDEYKRNCQWGTALKFTFAASSVAATLQRPISRW